MISAEKIFAVRSDAEFDAAALELFRFQAERCAPYAEYLRLLGVNPQEIGCVDEIPFMPIELFKTHDIYCGADAPQIVFTSSATTGMTPSRHPVADLAIYERDFTESFRMFYGEPSQWSIYGLLPNYLQRSGSSLVYMADRLIRECGSGGFYLDEYERLIDDMARDPKPKILLGVSYALWNLAERHAPRLENTVVMETGGMKGHRRELPKAEFHKILCDAFGVAEIHSEYGHGGTHVAGILVGRRRVLRSAVDARADSRHQRPVRPSAGRSTGRDRHNRPRQRLFVRIHRHAGCRRMPSRRRIRRGRTCFQ